MKIDIHAHTLKTKTGDNKKRNIEATKFGEIIKETDVEILAVTNHNYFDLKQFNDIVTESAGYCQIWPGVELDIKICDRRGHLIVIVNPSNAAQLEELMNQLVAEVGIEDFTISLEDTVAKFEKLDSIYIAHYYNKQPCLEDDDIENLNKLVNNSMRVIKEASNAISAGIFVSHGHKSIYGSDVQDWGNYIDESKNLPDLRLPVSSYEQFCLLLEKDETAINTILDESKYEDIDINPFDDDESIKISIYNDINVFFGSKGTGKTIILKAIKNLYCNRGISANLYESKNENLDDFYDIKGKNMKLEIEQLGVSVCKKEIELIKSAQDIDVTVPSAYYKYYSSEIKNRRAKNLKVDKYELEDDNTKHKNYEEIRKIYIKFKGFIEFISSSDRLQKIINNHKLDKLIKILTEYSDKIQKEVDDSFAEKNVATMFNNLVELFTEQIARKTGNPAKPLVTGFEKYARNRIELEKNAKKILDEINHVMPKIGKEVGFLDEKGKLEFTTEVKIQDGEISDSSYHVYAKGVNKTPQKDFAKKLIEVMEQVYTNNLFERITELNSITDIDKIKDIEDLVLFRRYFSIDGRQYKPSNGESSMVMLHNELSEDRDIYLLDEPEKSLGNDYINDFIVPLLKEKARTGKKIIIATHDANIAVRTLPYNTIYRKHDIDKYSTYVGNPFSNNLTNCNDASAILDWKEISMKTLEGGRDAFGERGKIYGN